MPNSCRCIIKKCLFKGAITEKEADKLLRNVVDVRCKDCKHCQHDQIFNELWCNGRLVREDFYCADAERMKGEEE